MIAFVGFVKVKPTVSMPLKPQHLALFAPFALLIVGYALWPGSETVVVQSSTKPDVVVESTSLKKAGRLQFVSLGTGLDPRISCGILGA